MKIRIAKQMPCELFLLGLLLLLAAAGSWLAPFDPDVQDLGQALQAPDAVHYLGTDRYGRDVLARVLAGAQTTIGTSLVIVGSIMLFGTALGALAGMLGGWTDTLLMRTADVFLAFPQMVFAVAAAGALGGGLGNAALALIVIGWPKYARIAASLTAALRERPFMQAARISGTKAWGRLIHHVLPNIAGPVLVTAALDIGTIIMELAGLSFLGLGAMPPTAEWGAMMSSGRSMLQTAPWVILAPGGAIFATVAVFNLLGDKLRDVLDTRKGQER